MSGELIPNTKLISWSISLGGDKSLVWPSSLISWCSFNDHKVYVWIGSLELFSSTMRTRMSVDSSWLRPCLNCNVDIIFTSFGWWWSWPLTTMHFARGNESDLLFEHKIRSLTRRRSQFILTITKLVCSVQIPSLIEVLFASLRWVRLLNS